MPAKTSYETEQYIIPYLKEYPNTPTNTLARMIYEKHNDTFKSQEVIRSALRYYRHSMGNAHRKHITTDEFKRLNGDDYRGWKGFSTKSVNFEDYHIPLVHKKTLLISDVHIPYHDQDAVMVALNYAASAGVDSVILNGDIIDFVHLSKFSKDPTKRNTQFEIDMLYEFFCIIQAVLGDVKIFYKQGNHEFRLENFLMIKAPELFGMEEFELPILAKFSDFGIEWIDKKRIILFDKLAVLHGHEFYGFSSAVNPARGLYLKSKKSAIVGHLHQTSEHSEPDLHGKPVGCWSIGCLCHLNPEYSPINKWNHGFAILTRDNGTFNVENRRIYKNKLL
jgi:predicted phosphodiesterase